MGRANASHPDEALETQPAPAAEPASASASAPSLTVVPARRSEELRDLQREVRRLLLLGTCVWPFFFLVDFFGAYADGGEMHLLWLAGWRLLGALLGAIAFVTVRNVELRESQLHAIDASVFAIGSILLTLLAIPFGGITSRSLTGVLVLVFARATLVPSHWRQALRVSLLSTIMLPLTMATAAMFDDRLRAQWASSKDVLIFLHNGVFVITAAVVGSIGSHLVWVARKQVYELRKVGTYRLRARIGAGGVGEVWLAWQAPPGREVAVKVLKGAALEDADAVHRFQREARTASSLTHPNTVHVFDYGMTEDGVLYIAMELLHGLNLDAIVRTYGAMPPARAIHFVRQACASLAEAHGRGIIHRDVKPANLFAVRSDSGDDTLKVLDFGLARLVRAGATATSPSPVTPEGIICGTPAFISPEAVAGVGIDARSDIYSLGAVLYYIVTGTVVYPHLTIAESIVAHVGRAPEPPSSRRADVPRDLERVILRCLEKRAEDRYASADELRAALGACADAGAWTRHDAFAFWDDAARHDHSMTRLSSP